MVLACWTFAIYKMAGSQSEKAAGTWKQLALNFRDTFFFTQMFFVVVLLTLILYGGYYHGHAYIPVPESNEIGVKLAYTLQCCGLPAVITLIMAVLMVECKRAFSAAINPLAGKEEMVQPDKNFLTNTVEQLLIFLFTSLVLSVYLQPMEMRIIPLYAVVFVVGRVIFRIGYGISPYYRLVGVEMNLCSNYIFAGLACYFLCTRGLMYSVIQTSIDSSSSAAAEKTEL